MKIHIWSKHTQILNFIMNKMKPKFFVYTNTRSILFRARDAFLRIGCKATRKQIIQLEFQL